MKFPLTIGMAVFFAATGCGHKNGPAENVASLDDLNRVLPVVAMRGGYSPPPTNEVAKFLALSGKTMPVPPLGKRLEIDLTTHQFVFVDE